MKQLFYSITAILLTGCQNEKSKPDKVNPEDLSALNFQKTEGKSLVFENGKKVVTDLFELQYIGKIISDDKVTYVVISGKDCSECDENTAIYCYAPANGKLEVRNGQNRFQYPGSETDYESEKVIYTSKAFYGEVLEGVKGIIWYDNDLSDKGGFVKSTYLAEITKNSIHEKKYNGHSDFAETEKMLKQGRCKEIVGKEYSSEP